MSFSAWLMVGIITSTTGMAVFVYGRRQDKIVPMLSGVFLIIYPYFFDNLLLIIITGIVLLLLPFISALDF